MEQTGGELFVTVVRSSEYWVAMRPDGSHELHSTIRGLWSSIAFYLGGADIASFQPHVRRLEHWAPIRHGR